MGGVIIGSTAGPPSRGRCTSGTVDVLDTNFGSEIMPFVTDFLRVPDGVALPGIADGVVRPFVLLATAGFGEGMADDGGDIGVTNCDWWTPSPGLGEGLGDGRGVKPLAMSRGPAGTRLLALKYDLSP